jgi:uncharacterized membrane protein YGL010W
MSKVSALLDKYGESHQNHTNKLIHWICVPTIMFSLLALVYAIPFFMEKTMLQNWAAVLLFFALIYYLRLSISLFLGFVVITLLMLWGINELYLFSGKNSGTLALYALGIFVLAWIGQFIGHKIEGKKPSFLEDIQFLLIGPAWLLHFIYKKVGIGYEKGLS